MSVAAAGAVAGSRGAAGWERPCAVRVQARLVLLGCSALWGCPDSAPTASDVWPLAPLRLPSLSCLPPVEPRGECVRASDCADHEVCGLDPSSLPEDREPAVLACRAPLGAGAARAPCGQGDECASALCSLGGACLAPCAQDADCPLGQACQPVEARIEQGLTPLQACARVASFPADVELRLEPLEPLPGAALSQRSLQVEGEVATSFLLAECGASLRLTEVAEQDSERVLFDLAAQLNGQVQVNPVVNEGALLPLLIPNNPRLPLAPAYTLSLRSDVATTLQVIHADRTQQGDLLDLNVFYVGGGESVEPGGLHPGDARFAQVIERIDERLVTIGLGLGEVREFDVLGALRAELSELEVSTSGGQESGAQVVGLDRLLGLSAGLEQGGVNVFLVQRMGPLNGIAGGTPGGVGLHGSSASGVALALDQLGLEHADRAMFHEIGHQLGLFHTSERDGSTLEPLRDTPACGPEQDADGDGVLRAAECGEHGADNLMFWEGQGDALSAEQVAILASSAILR